MKTPKSMAIALPLAFSAALLAAPAASAATPEENDALVNSWYVDFLARDLGSGNDPGAQYWVEKLDAGQSAQSVLAEIVKTREFATTETEVYYQYYLNRSANGDAGSRYWSDGIQNDMAPEWVVQNILASPEFAEGVTDDFTDDSNFVRFLYYDVVGRSNPSDGEVQYWVNRLRELNGDRLRLVREMWYAPDSVSNRIQGHYSFLLEREQAPSAGEVNYWRAPEVESDLRTQVAFAVTPEYLAQTQVR